MKKPVIFALFIGAFLFLGACALPGLATNRPSTDQIATSVQETSQLVETQYAFATLAAQATALSQGTPLPTAEQVTATSEPGQATAGAGTPYPSLTPYPTLTTYPTLTPYPSLTPAYYPSAPPTVTAPAVPCNLAQFVADVSVPDGTDFWPGETFTKAWRLKNIGACTWSSDYSVVFVAGDQMNGPDSDTLGVTVRPGEVVDIVVGMKAPAELDNYVGYWKLRSNNGATFGIGTNAAGSFTTQIDVVKKPTFQNTVILNMVNNFCRANWKTSTSSSLYCPGVPGFSSSIVYRSMGPKVEGNYTENEAALVTVPSTGDTGYISGRYPVYTAKSGDHFKAVVGCLYGYYCDVNFQLRYVTVDANNDESTETTLKTWNHKVTNLANNNTIPIDWDLSSLDGKKVRLILRVNNNGDAKDDRAFWLVPVVTRPLAPALTVTVSADPATYSAVGTNITYTYSVKNTGGAVAAGPIVVKDDRLGDTTCLAAGSNLAVGATVTCTNSYTTTQANLDAGAITSKISAVAGTVISPTVSFKVNATVSIKLTLEVSADKASYSAAGEVITFSYKITNASNVTLPGPFNISNDKAKPTPVVYPDPIGPGQTVDVPTTATYTITAANVAGASVTNNSRVSVVYKTVTYRSTVVPFTIPKLAAPALSLSKTASTPTYAAAGTVISYSFVITNTGNVALPGPFTLADTMFPDLVCATGSLAIGASRICDATHTAKYTVTQEQFDAGTAITNTATVTTTYNSTPVEATDSVEVTKQP